MPQISKLVRAAIYNQLSNATSGFNAQLAAIASAYNIKAFTIDWSPTSHNFYFGRISPTLLDSIDAIAEIGDPTSILASVVLTIDTLGDEDTRAVTSSIFAGRVRGVINLTLSWETSQMTQNLPDWSDACEDAMFTAMNSAAYQNLWLASGTSYVYDPKMVMVRGPLLAAGDNLSQTLEFLPQFTVIR